MAHYKIKSIERVNPPAGTQELKWYKFIIGNDKNTIINLRSGSKQEVHRFAEESIKRLNEKYFTHVHFKVHKPVYEVQSVNYLY